MKDLSADNELTKDSVLDILSDESVDDKADDKIDGEGETDDEESETDEDEETEEDTEEEGAEDKEDDEIKLAEDEEEEDKDEDLDKLITPFRKKDLLKKYPSIFKDFPDLEAGYYQSRQYREVFPTPEDAQEAAEKAELLDQYESGLIKGDISDTLNAIKENDPKAFARTVDNYLTTLGKVDKEAYYSVTSGVMKTAIISMVREAKETNDKNLYAHAQAMHEYVFGTKKITYPTKMASEAPPNDEEEQVNQERQELAVQKYENARDGLQKRVDSVLMSTIMSNIDPKNTMTGFVKKHAAKEAFDKLEKALIGDRILAKQLTSLWKASQEDNYSSSSLEKIKSAFLSKAKVSLKKAIDLARGDALKGSSKESNSERRANRGHLPVGRSSSTGKTRGKSEIPKGMSVRDFIMQD